MIHQFVKDNGVPYVLKKEKLGQVISKVFGKILIKVRIINRVHHNFYQGLRLLMDNDREQTVLFFTFWNISLVVVNMRSRVTL